jgi:UTP--glucose-1-phosphate uridylyltransferase
MANVTKAVLAAAGFGTLFLPQTKAMPKEMLPLVDKPVIQYVVEGLVEAGITDIIIVGSGNKRAIEDHFDLPAEELVANLEAGDSDKRRYIDELKTISGLANFIYVRQKGPYGTGTPLLNAAPIIGNEPFIYTYPDDLTFAEPNTFRQLMDIYEELDASVMSCFQISEDFEYDRYGLAVGEEMRPGLVRMTGVSEKPGYATAPSNLANSGTYLFTSDIFEYLRRGMNTLPAGEELLITARAIDPMLRAGVPMYGYRVQNAHRYDVGTPVEYLKTLFSFALRHEEVGAELKEFLHSQLNP